VMKFNSKLDWLPFTVHGDAIVASVSDDGQLAEKALSESSDNNRENTPNIGFMQPFHFKMCISLIISLARWFPTGKN
jgi:hypothetical protein